MRLVLAVEALYLHAELVGKDGVEEDAYESGEGKTGKGDGANLYATVGAILHADGHHQDESSHKHVAR